MNSNVLVVWKEIGETPLEAIIRLKAAKPELINEKISYAGRLDPMAEGILLLLVGDENKKREQYQNLEKEYESEIILGVATDTYDALGMITKVNSIVFSEENLLEALKHQKEKRTQKYPPYSSRTVNGKPLYWYARNNAMEDIVIPEHTIAIHSLELFAKNEVASEVLLREVFQKIHKVSGDFRQDQICNEWEKQIGRKSLVFVKISLRIACSSGAYIRKIASDIGEEVGAGAFALSIKRTRVGEFLEDDIILPRVS